MDIYNIQLPKGKRVPVLISSPHSGIGFPDEVKAGYWPEMINPPCDTDFEMPELYNFASELGITMISANLSRWVIDLNRDPESAPLYNDGRLITGLCSMTTFEGEHIYRNEGPDDQEVQRRLETYYWPYYQKVQELLDDLKAEFGHVLLYDLHSITRQVDAISKDPFPDFVMGTADGSSCDERLTKVMIDNFENSEYQFQLNHPFKGGHITRYFGKPEKHQHAIQLERSKDIYLDSEERHLDQEKIKSLRTLLKKNLEDLIKVTLSL